MANVSAPRGFVWVKNLQGESTPAHHHAAIADNHTTSAIYCGDPVQWDSGYIVLAAAGEGVCGIFAGCTYTITATGERVRSKYYDGVTGKSSIVAEFIPVSNNIFEIEYAGTLAATDIGTAKNHVAGTGNAKTGWSGAELNTSGDGIRIIGYPTHAAGAENALGASAKVHVMFLNADDQLGA